LQRGRGRAEKSRPGKFRAKLLRKNSDQREGSEGNALEHGLARKQGRGP